MADSSFTYREGEIVSNKDSVWLEWDRENIFLVLNEQKSSLNSISASGLPGTMIVSNYSYYMKI